MEASYNVRIAIVENKTREKLGVLIDQLRAEPEKEKVDFKRWEKEVELVKIISAIANTDGQPENNPLFEVLGDDYGLVVLGVADDGEVVGIPRPEEEEQTRWLWHKEDGINGALADKLRKWIAPLPQVEVYVFEEDNKRWVAFLIFPSTKQPHIFIRNGEGIQKGDWYVRRLTTTERAGPEDLVRVMRKPIEALQREINRVEARLNGRLDEAFSQIHRWTELLSSRGLDALAREADPATRDAVSAGLPPHERIRRRLGRSSDPVAEALNEAFDRLTSGVKSAGIPWAPHPATPEEAKGWIERLEEVALPAIQAVAALVALDEKGNYASLLQELLETYAEDFGEPPVNTTFNQAGRSLHLYPLVLLHYAVAVVAYAHQRVAYLRVLKNATWLVRNEKALPQVPEVQDRAIRSRELFHFADQKNLCDPLAMHALPLLLKEQGILRGVLPRRALRDPDQLFLEAELALALIGMENTLGEMPFFGNYVYGSLSSTHRAACRLLKKGSFLEEVLGKPVRKALEQLLRALEAMTMRGSLPCDSEGIIGLARCLERDTGAG